MSLESHGVLHPDSHIFSQEEFYEDEPELLVEIMNQLSLKAGLKEWGDRAHTADKSKMKQMHFSNMFIPMYQLDLTYE